MLLFYTMSSDSPIYVAAASSQLSCRPSMRLPDLPCPVGVAVPNKEFQLILSSIVVLQLQMVSRSGMEDKQQQPQLDE